MTQVDFARLAGETVRVTSLVADRASGVVTLVVIARGSTDSRKLGEIVAAPTVTFQPHGDAVRDMAVVDVQRTTSGEGERLITRFSIVLAPSDVEEPIQPTSLTERLASLERRAEDLLEAIRDLRRAAR